jgi:hypothetical protein
MGLSNQLSTSRRLYRTRLQPSTLNRASTGHHDGCCRNTVAAPLIQRFGVLRHTGWWFVGSSGISFSHPNSQDNLFTGLDLRAL